VVLLGNDIPFTIEATDSDGTVQSVVISEGDSVLTTLTAAPWTWTWVNAPAGRHRLSVVATDDAGSTRTISGWTVIVNQPPTATITAPADGAVIVADASATVSVLAADSDGQVVQVALR